MNEYLPMETALSIAIGLGLSAACGFRVFVPLLIAGIAARTGHLDLIRGFDWMGSNAALIAFGTATLIEVGAYYFPVIDNILDSVATPAAVIAGTLVTASLVADVDPFLRWTLALIAGGGIAGIVQAGTVVTRGASTVTTAGFANPLVATAELGGALVTALLSIAVPFLVAGLVLFVMVPSVLYWWIRRRRIQPEVSGPAV